MADITAGEFTPSCDPARAHCLSRLILATSEIGTFNDAPNDTPTTALLGHHSSSSYQPSWGRGITSQTFHRVDQRAPNIFEVTGVRLSAPATGETFTLQKTSDHTASLQELDLDFSLTLGPGLRESRELITYLTQSFFDQNVLLDK